MRAASASASPSMRSALLLRAGSDRRDFAFLLPVDVGRFAFAFGTEARRDLMTFARHAVVDFHRHGRVVFAALEARIEQLDAEVGDLLARARSVICSSICERGRARCREMVVGRMVPLCSSSLSRSGSRPLVTRMISTRSCVATAVRVSLIRMSSRRERALRSSFRRL